MTNEKKDNANQQAPDFASLYQEQQKKEEKGSNKGTPFVIPSASPVQTNNYTDLPKKETESVYPVYEESLGENANSYVTNESAPFATPVDENDSANGQQGFRVPTMDSLQMNQGEIPNQNNNAQQFQGFQQQTVNPQGVFANGTGGSKTHVLSIISMVAGILSIVCCCIPPFNGILGIAAVVLGFLTIKQFGGAKSITGIITGFIGIVVAIVMLFAVSFIKDEALNSGIDDWNSDDSYEEYEDEEYDENDLEYYYDDSYFEEEDAVSYQIINLTDMLNVLDENALKAETIYQDTYIEVTGYISNIDSDGAYISITATNDEWDWNSVQCYLKEESQVKLILEKAIGDAVTIKGQVTSVGEILGYSIDIHEIQ